MADAGWIWEGQGLDPGVFPSIFGVGEGADFFGLRKVHFMFHPTTDLALRKLSRFDEVVCDISKWRFRNCGEGHRGSECYCDSSLEDICAEAEKVSRLSCAYSNVTGGFFDDMKGLMQRRGHGLDQGIAIKAALRKHNPALNLESVVYRHELASRDFWQSLMPLIDVISFWVWEHQELFQLEDHLAGCCDLFPDKPIILGCYLRDYPSQGPVPMPAVRHQWRVVAQALEDGRIRGFDILGAVTIDGQIEQAMWIRDFIRDHS
jgi:hypothetical protein